MPKISIRKPITIVLTLEGLATASLGCYGSSWNETPAIDTLASEGVVWDRWISPDDRPGQLIRNWLREARPAITSVGRRGKSVFVSDDPQIDFESDDSPFSSIVRIEHPARDSVAGSIDQTRFASTIATAIDNLDGETQLVWIHSGALRDTWDAPDVAQDESELIEAVEPVPESEVDAFEADDADPQPVYRLPSGPNPPRIRRSSDDDPDMLFAWMNRYGQQVRVVDAMIESLIDVLADRRLSMIVAGSSSFALGENGWLGHHCGPLRGCDVRLPMIASPGGPLRVPQICDASTFSQLLARFVARDPLVPVDQWKQTDQEFSPAIETRSDRASKAVTTARWFFVADSSDDDQAAPTEEKLFLKPDDMNDVNNVARLRPDVVDQLTSAAAGNPEA